MKVSSIIIGTSIVALGVEALTLLALYQSENRRYEDKAEPDDALYNTDTRIDMLSEKFSELERKLLKLDIDIDQVKVKVFPDAY